MGAVVGGEMVLNEYGKIVQRQWQWLAEHFPNVQLDEFQIMPNHVHGIVIITPAGNGQGGVFVGDGRDRPVQKPLPDLIGAFKTTSSKLIHRAGFTDFSWHRSFYDHVIRKDESLDKVREYIRNNPKQWELDEENPINIKKS